MPDQVELLRWLRGAGERMARSETARLETARQRLTALAAMSSKCRTKVRINQDHLSWSAGGAVFPL